MYGDTTAAMTSRALGLLLLGKKCFRSKVLLLPVARAPAARAIFPGAWEAVHGLRARPLLGLRFFSAASGEGGEEGEKEGEREGESDGEGGTGLEALIPAAARQHAIAPVSVPENFPEVPVLPVSRNPIFPRFVRMLEVRLWAYPSLLSGTITAPSLYRSVTWS